MAQGSFLEGYYQDKIQSAIAQAVYLDPGMKHSHEQAKSLGKWWCGLTFFTSEPVWILFLAVLMFRGFVDGWWWPTINHLTNSFSLTLQEDVSILTHLRLVCFKVFKNIWILCTVEIETLFVVFCEWIWTWTVAAGKSCRVAASLEACLCAKLGFMGSDVRTCSSYFSPFSKQFDPESWGILY